MLSVITSLTFFLMPAQTVLYDSALEPVVTLPAGYFLLHADSSAPGGFISVVYDDLTGYVKTDCVTEVDYTPVTKYETTVSFGCDNDGQPVNLRSAPRRAASVIKVLPSTAKGHCYGAATGDTLIAGAGDVWYYVDYGGTHGYCYGAHVSVDPTPPNVIEKEPPPDVPTTTVPTSTEEKPMSSVAAIIFIVALCIPVPFVMFYLFRKPKDKDKDDDR